MWFCTLTWLMHKCGVTVCPKHVTEKRKKCRYSEDPWMCVCLWYQRASHVCTFTVSSSWKGRRGLDCLCSCFVWVLHAGAVEHSTLPVALYVPGPVSILCVFLGYMLRFATGWTGRQASGSCVPPASVESPGPWAELHAGAGRQDGALGWNRQPRS